MDDADELERALDAVLDTYLPRIGPRRMEAVLQVRAQDMREYASSSALTTAGRGGDRDEAAGEAGDQELELSGSGPAVDRLEGDAASLGPTAETGPADGTDDEDDGHPLEA